MYANEYMCKSTIIEQTYCVNILNLMINIIKMRYTQEIIIPDKTPPNTSDLL